MNDQDRDRIHANETALVIVDAQNMWFHVTGKMYLAEANAQIPAIEDLASYFRQIGSHVIYTKVVWDTFKDVPKSLIKARPQFREGWIALKRGSFFGEIHEGLAPAEGDLIVEKRYFDAFQTGNLEQMLGAEIRTLVFTGTTLNNCIYSTLLSASQLGYNTVTVRDCISAFSDDNIEHWYNQMRNNLGTQVMTAKEMTELMKP